MDGHVTHPADPESKGRQAPTPSRLLPATLEARSGPEIFQATLSADQPALIGRTSGATVVLNHRSVSREHACLTHHGGVWSLADQGSKHGTFVNGVRLSNSEAVPLKDGDRIDIGPWTFRFTQGGRSPEPVSRSTPASSIVPVSDRGGEHDHVTRISRVDLGTLAQKRLDVLIEVAAALSRAEDAFEVARLVTNALVRGTGFGRAALVRPEFGVQSVEVLAAEENGVGVADPAAFRFSRSLLAAAMEGDIAQVRSEPALQQAVSIMELRLSEAICAPVRVESSIDALLYADAERGRSDPLPDAAAFVSAVAELCGFALSNLARRDLEERQRALVRDLKVARRVQERLMPAPAGEVHGVRYALKSIPGRHVAGDLFGLTGLDDGRLAVFIGDVVGKGLAAGILMAIVQAQLEAELTGGRPLVDLIRRVNRFVAEHSAPQEFVTLWIGLIDPARCTLECLDAGHGYAAAVHGSGGAVTPEQLRCEGGVPLGVEADSAYTAGTIELPPRSRLVLMSDGLIEQPCPEGSEFTFDRVLELLRESSAEGEDVRTLLSALERHTRGESTSGTIEFADDVTVASLRLPG